MNSGVNRRTHRYPLVWSISTPRFGEQLLDVPGRRGCTAGTSGTATVMTSAGNRNPANPERCDLMVFTWPPCCIDETSRPHSLRSGLPRRRGGAGAEHKIMRQGRWTTPSAKRRRMPVTRACRPVAGVPVLSPSPWKRIATLLPSIRTSSLVIPGFGDPAAPVDRGLRRASGVFSPKAALPPAQALDECGPGVEAMRSASGMPPELSVTLIRDERPLRDPLTDTRPSSGVGARLA
jgi:hypothetical protein